MRAPMSFQQVQLLLIDGDDDEANYIEKILQKDQVNMPLTRVPDGKSALAILCGNDGYARLPRPYIILAVLPPLSMSIFQFLHHLHADPELRPSRVFVLADAASELDRDRRASPHIAGCILKSNLRQSPKAFANLLRGYAEFVELLPSQ